MERLHQKDFVGMLRRVCQTIVKNEEALCKLDSYVGDGDHGVTVARGFAAVEAKLAGMEDAPIKALLDMTGDTLAETMGGAIGPIFGSIFSAMGEECRADEVGSAELAVMLDAGLENVMLIGGAAPGDRTLVDALAPAVEAAKTAAADRAAVSEALSRAASAAKQGAEATKDMVAKKGRAKFLQDKSKGYQDAGATSMELVLEAMAAYCA